MPSEENYLILGNAAIKVVEALASSGYDWHAEHDGVSTAYGEYLRARGPKGPGVSFELMNAVLQAAGHETAECSECGSEFCRSAMHEVEAGVHAHSQDFSYRFVCPYCWQKEGVVPA